MKDIKSVSIRIPAELLKEFRYVSEFEKRSINSQVLYVMRKCVAEFKKEHGDFEVDVD